MKRIAFLILNFSFLISTQSMYAQPTKRRTTTSNAAAQRSAGQQKQTVDRASLMFPTSAEMPEDVVWRRDIYRQLDLLADKNAPLYYPVEPTDQQVNLFTYIFRLFLAKRVSAYKYNLDGNESFAEKDRVTDVKEVLERNYIYYEEKDGKITVADNDIPSANVTRYYIKESSFFDQRTGTYRAKVTALCPILIEEGEPAKPLFWMKYDDVAPFLSRLPIMTSNLNNITNMTADDYFTMNRYEGKIYKTANMQGRILVNETDTAKVEAEQKRIEQQLEDFEKNIWHHQEKPDTLDSVAVAEPKKNAVKRQRAATTATSKEKQVQRGSTASRRSSAGSSAKEKKPKSSSGSSAPAASVRRQRR